jgi:hypothetical protein
MQGYHFPPPEPDPNYAYGNQQPMPPPQWGQQADPHGYELSYQAYSAADPSPFANATPHQQQGYGEGEADYGEEYFEDEEPRRGRRWILIVVALVGAIGVGGALAYTYRALVASHGRVPVLKADTNVKVKPDFPAKQAAVPERKLPTRDDPPPQQPGDAQDEPPAESVNQGPRIVRPIPIVPGVAPPPQAAATSAVPGITLYQPPQAPQPPQQQVAAIPPAAQAPPTQMQPKVVMPPKAQPQQPGRITIGTRPPAAEPDDDPPVAPPPAKKVQTGALPKPIERAPSSGASMGLGYVAVLSSKKSRMDALTEFADLRDKYPNVLGDKTPDVQEADLSARGLGTMYRLLVGPPISHTGASNVCAQLKAAGYVGCWVKEY